MTTDAITRHNLTVETCFSAFNGVFMAMILFAAPVIAATCLNASITELTIIVGAFPCGAFLGPLWAGLGRRWGMKKLVLQMAIWANLPLFVLFWTPGLARFFDVSDSVIFTAVIATSQLLHSGMRMGQSSMYRVTYPRAQLGRVLGRLNFWTFLTMVLSVLLAGWLSDADNYPASYQILYPFAGLSGLIGCRFYAMLRLLDRKTRAVQPAAPVAGITNAQGSVFNRVLLQPLSQQARSLSRSFHGVRKVVMSDRAYMFFQLAFFLSGSAFFMTTHIVLLLAKDRLHFGALESSVGLYVLPQLLLALCSPVWGRVVDKMGIVRARLLISTLMTVYLTSYFFGIALEWPMFIIVGSVLRGVAEGGGQVTWALASVHFAPKSEDVPLYNGIHFLLNGVRGLVMPSIGSILFLFVQDWTILVGTLVSAASILVILHSFRYGHGPEQEEAALAAVSVTEPASESAANV